MPDACVVLVTAPDEEVAARICRGLVEEGLVACGTIVPRVRSVYRWEGEVCDESEALIVLKTDRARVPEVVRRVPDVHPYEIPEVLVLAVEAGHVPYLEWVAHETTGRT